jgi:hypothetical protein
VEISLASLTQIEPDPLIRHSDFNAPMRALVGIDRRVRAEHRWHYHSSKIITYALSRFQHADIQAPWFSPTPTFLMHRGPANASLFVCCRGRAEINNPTSEVVHHRPAH